MADDSSSSRVPKRRRRLADDPELLEMRNEMKHIKAMVAENKKQLLIEDALSHGVVPNLKRLNVIGQGPKCKYPDLEIELADAIRRCILPEWFTEQIELLDDEELLSRKVRRMGGSDFVWDGQSVIMAVRVWLDRLIRERALSTGLNDDERIRGFYAEKYGYQWLNAFLKRHHLRFYSMSRFEKYAGLSISEIQDRVTTTLFKFNRICRSILQSSGGTGRIIMLCVDETSIMLEPGAGGSRCIGPVLPVGSQRVVATPEKSSRRLVTMIASMSSHPDLFSPPQHLVLGATVRDYERRLIAIHYGIDISEAELKDKRSNYKFFYGNPSGVGVCFSGNKNKNAHLDGTLWENYMQNIRGCWARRAAVFPDDRLVVIIDGARSHKISDGLDVLLEQAKITPYVLQPELTSHICCLDVFAFSPFKSRLKTEAWRIGGVSVLHDWFRQDLIDFDKKYGRGLDSFRKLGFSETGLPVPHSELHSRLQPLLHPETHHTRMSMLNQQDLSMRQLRELREEDRRRYLDERRWMTAGVVRRQNRELIALSRYSLMEVARDSARESQSQTPVSVVVVEDNLNTAGDWVEDALAIVGSASYYVCDEDD